MYCEFSMTHSMGSGGVADEALGSVEEVDGRISICDHESLDTQTLQELGLHFRASLSNGGQSLGSNGLDQLRELGRLDLGHGAA